MYTELTRSGREMEFECLCLCVYVRKWPRSIWLMSWSEAKPSIKLGALGTFFWSASLILCDTIGDLIPLSYVSQETRKETWFGEEISVGWSDSGSVGWQKTRLLPKIPFSLSILNWKQFQGHIALSTTALVLVTQSFTHKQKWF